MLSAISSYSGKASLKRPSLARSVATFRLALLAALVESSPSKSVAACWYAASAASKSASLFSFISPMLMYTLAATAKRPMST